MNELLEKIWNKTINDAINLEKKDFQYISLEKLYKNIKNKDIFLNLIITNSIICYQLSWKWEDYWEEFNNYFSKNEIKKEDIIKEMITFISNSKNNKRLLQIKIKRLQKLNDFILQNNSKKPLEILEKLKKTLNQKSNAKTIVFAIKMWNYWYSIMNSQNNILPFEIEIPIDSRLTNIYNKYNTDNLSINDFYNKLSQKLQIPPLHLDAILWVKYKKYIN